MKKKEGEEGGEEKENEEKGNWLKKIDWRKIKRGNEEEEEKRRKMCKGRKWWEVCVMIEKVSKV